ncbi:MAG: D-aminoacyl-tRNA deacylase [Acidimicrobiales bacterium]|nr:D-aminoacyl-tRNA deacylase [Acidimicrobiales bacterium]
MRAVVQRVSEASVTVGGEVSGRIGQGLCVLVGVTHDDGPDTASTLARKLWRLRLFPDAEGRMDRSAEDVGAEVLVISQFTLYGDTSRGRRPGWSAAAPGAVAEPLVETLVVELTALGARVATGRFGAEMQVALVNDGPVTVIVEV